MVVKKEDYRDSTFLGTWKKSIPYEDDTIAMDDLDEPHKKRKLLILKKHPEISDLAGYTPVTKYITLVVLTIQLGLAYVFAHVYPEGWLALAVTAYVVGGTLTQTLGMIIHECSHNLTFKSTLMNRLHGLVANIGIVFPIAQSFRRYHLDHHAYQGVVGMDPDLPIPWEYYLIKGNSFLKFIWLFCFSSLYVIRGLYMGKSPQFWEYVNTAFTVVSDLAIFHFLGGRGFLYLFLSLWFGYGVHPAAGHFVQEHYTFEDGQETYSYYGSLNFFLINVGYHNEHHDFTNVAWTKLPLIKKIAPEFYETLGSHYSYIKMMCKFIFDPTYGPQSRLGRNYEDHVAGRDLTKEAVAKFD